VNKHTENTSLISLFCIHNPSFPLIVVVYKKKKTRFMWEYIQITEYIETK